MPDLVVVGGGIAGVGAALAGARRGLRVTLLERGELPHLGMPSYGDTRVFRMAYFEAPDYVPFLKQASATWREWSAESHLPIFEETGVLMAGPGDSPLVEGARSAAGEHELELEVISGKDAHWDYTDFHFDPDDTVLIDRRGGFLHARNATEFGLSLCRQSGVKIVTGAEVDKVMDMGRDVLVTTCDGRAFEAAYAVVCAGAGFDGMTVGMLMPQIRVVPQLLTYWNLGGKWESSGGSNRPMVFAFQEFDGDFFYGIPRNATESLVKVALHDTEGNSGGMTPEERIGKVRRWISSRLNCTAELYEKSVECSYDMGRDGQLALGRVPHCERIGVIGSMSGHGFKFGPALGEAVVAELVDGESRIPYSLDAGNLFES